MTRRHVERPGPPPASARTSLLGWAVVVGLTVAAVGGGLWWWSGETGVEKVRGIEQALLAGALSGRSGKRAVDEIVRTVDRMRPEEIKEVRQSLEEEWQRLCREDIEAYRAAPSDEQVVILDRSIARGLVYQELQFAVNPRAGSRNYRPRKPRNAAVDGQAAGDPAADVGREDRDRFRAAVQKRARERRIDVPAWQEPALAGPRPPARRD